MKNVAIDKIFPNPDQPRREFSALKLESLSQSIAQNGLLQPIVVVKRGDRFMIVCGERRWRASKMAGKKEIQARIVDKTDLAISQLALLENLQRENLNPVEEAQAYQGLMDQGMTIEEIAQKMGFKQKWRIRERLDLLKLLPQYRRALVEGRLSNSQAFEMSRLPQDRQHILFEKIIAGKVDNYEQLRATVNAMLVESPEQANLMGLRPDPEASRIYEKYEKLLERICTFVRNSFSEKDMKVLPSVIKGSGLDNIQRIDGVISDLVKIKKALIQANAAMEAAERCVS